jgi:lysophospholipase L1-like esterase
MSLSAIRQKAQEIIDMATALESQNPPLDFPAPTDCLGGPKPFIPQLLASVQDLTYYNTRRNYPLLRLHDNSPDGSILFYGDSIFEGMSTSDVTPFGVSHAISGNTFRGVLNQLVTAPSIRRAGAVVLMIGINDLARDSAPMVNVPYMYDLLSGWITGHWVICHILPINSTMWTPTGGATNDNIRTVNAHINTKYGNKPNVSIVDVADQLAPQRELLPAYTPDGIHLNAAGYVILKTAIKAAL